MFDKFVQWFNPLRFSIVLFLINVLTAFFTLRKGMIDKIITSDALGYYQYLPGFFINGDLKHLPWAIIVENENHLNLFHVGVAILQLPFFLIAHLIATISGMENDGYGNIYAWSILIGTMFYVSLGLYFLFKYLLIKWSKPKVLLTLILLFFGTNIYYYSTMGGGYSHAYTFSLFCLFIYFTHQYHNKPSYKIAALIGLLSGLILIIKPNNLIISLFFVFYCLKSGKEIKDRILFFLKNYGHVLLILFVIFLCTIPQMLYWHHVSGDWLLFSYGENDQQFFWTNPQLIQVMGHPQNGWLLYSPVMIFALIYLAKGVFQLKNNHHVIFIIWAISWYIFASWWCWWFGAGFGHRAFVEYLPLMAIPFAYFIEDLGKWRKSRQTLMGMVLVLFVFMSVRMTFLYHWPWDGPDWYWDDYFNILKRVFFR